MTLSVDLRLVERALDALERREVRVLVWGLVDSALSEQEVIDTLDSVLNHSAGELRDPSCTIDTASALRERLINSALLFEVPPLRPTNPVRWRTRMAEGLRLMARLRQMFPGRHEGPGWVSAPTLVADFRLLWRPRRYPRRNRLPQLALDELETVVSPAAMAAVKHWFDKSPWPLAQFQVDTAARILPAVTTGSPLGTMVAAGTGSGKTLAFYIPALSWLAAEKKASPLSRGTRILALYPRNELLKDQLAEVYQQSRKFDDFHGPLGVPPISVGVLYGSTPTTLKSAAEKWTHTRDGVVCPYMRCTCDECDGELVLRPGDSQAGVERLVCSSCGSSIDGQTLRLTRRSLQAAPPDILFTSVEMLNQRMSDSEMRHLFGLGPRAQRSPAIVLLDEVHVYSGTYGAQVAHLLRRWSALTGRRSNFVGLSATIAEGATFFAGLTGMDTSLVQEITPREEDMEREGAEYMVALRGDPVSQSALLSTSIQALMLASRLLDDSERFRIDLRPFYGWRAFAFTDQVDATNRLYYDLLDAEGRNRFGNPALLRHPIGGLAALRVNRGDARRYAGGQEWRLPEKIGHDLTARHGVSRTTAYDSGVDTRTEVVVATAALEVGYDDPAVGVVLQHKAPRDMAQFLQRKGRAGRTRHMRPWTIMVLSDYGRDRLAYQTYEQFFDPELPARELPLANRYVRRMQAVYSVIDYLGVRMQLGEPAGSVWRDLSKPQEFPEIRSWPPTTRERLSQLSKDNTFPLQPGAWRELSVQARQAAPRGAWDGSNWLAAMLRRRHLVNLMGRIVKEPASAEALGRHIGSALQLPRQEVETLLWDHPRPILLSAVPTALRRLSTGWRAEPAGGHPLPEFVPGTLFSDLSLPEMRIAVGERNHYLPVQQGLSELAPGKVSRRFDDALWLGVDAALLQQVLDLNQPVAEHEAPLENWYDLSPQGSLWAVEEGQAVQYSAFRPLASYLVGTPRQPEVRDTSNARLEWRTQLFARRSGAVFEPPATRVGIARLVESAHVHTHAGHSPATVKRYAIASHASLRLRHGRETTDQTLIFRFRAAQVPAGVGFEMEVDAIRFVLRLSSAPHGDIPGEDASTLRAVRSSRYAWEASHGPVLAAVEPNTFRRVWLAQIFKAAVLTVASLRACSLKEAIDAVASGHEQATLRQVLQTVFQSPQREIEGDEGEDIDESSKAAQPDRLRQALVKALANSDMLAALAATAAVLVEPIDASWDEWLNRSLMQTLGAALLEAVQELCPQVDVADLAVDVEPGPLEDGTLRTTQELWLSEANPGGNGLVEQIQEVLVGDATRFYRQIEAALGASEFEVIDSQLKDFLHRIGGPNPDYALVQDVIAVRTASDTEAAQRALAALRAHLLELGHSVFHGYVSALTNRLLRPDSPASLDEVLAELMSRWDTLEQTYSVEIDARVVCALFSQDERIDAAFSEAGMDPPEGDRAAWRFSILSGIVWARGHALRAAALPLHLQYATVAGASERLLLRRWLTPPEPAIDASRTGWEAEFHERLIASGRARVATPSERTTVDALIQCMLTSPVQLDYLNAYPRLASVTRHSGTVEFQFELAEVL
jgi:hypothetical protein